MLTGRHLCRDGSLSRLAVYLVWWLLAAGLGPGAPLLGGETQSASPNGSGTAVLLEMEGPIGPATDDYLGRSLKKAREMGAEVVIVRMDTPGGLDASMRTIIRKILDSPVPIAVFVAPEGARATSAGTYILYASHVAAMTRGTHLGAATPVRLGGGGSPPMNFEPQEDEEESEESGPDAMERKMISDAVAYIKGLAELRGRNAEWAEKAVREGVSLTSSEAIEMNVIDFLVQDIDALLEAMDGYSVEVLGAERALATKNLTVEVIEPDWRNRLLAILTNPNLAFILMMLGVYGLILEFANPGALVPGVTGAICLILALFAFQLLPVNYAGLALIFLGVALMIAEAFAPSFGALGIGGVIAFIFGGIILIEPNVPGFEISMPVILTFAALSAVVFVFVLSMALKAWRRPVVSGTEALLGALGTAMDNFDNEGRVNVQGESWRARTDTPVRKGQTVRVSRVDNLLLTVVPEPQTEQEKKP